MLPLYLLTHGVLNQIKMIVNTNEEMRRKEGGERMLLIGGFHLHPYPQVTGTTPASYLAAYSQLTILELLCQMLTQVFHEEMLLYLVEYYDWNFMEIPICLHIIKVLYEFVEDNNNESRPEYPIFKKTIAQVNRNIEHFLHQNQPMMDQVRKDVKEIRRFYELKKKEYEEIVNLINVKPKEIFNRIRELHQSNPASKDEYVQKCVRILKKSVHINPKAMI